MATDPSHRDAVPIKPETAETIRKVLRAAFIRAAFPEEAEEIVNGLLEGKLPDDKESLVSAIFASVAMKQLEEKLRGMSEPTTDELKEIFAQMEEIPRQLKGPLAALAKKMPHPRGGAPRRFKTETDEEQVCELVGTYLGKGFTLPEALTKVAKVKDVSLRTMQRIWQANKKRNESRER